MDFMSEVTGDAFNFMVDEWGERDSFTRDELGGAPDWADYVNPNGVLLTEHEMEDLLECDLNDMYDVVKIGFYTFEVGAMLRAVDPIAFREEMLAWIDARVRDGDLRRVED